MSHITDFAMTQYTFKAALKNFLRKMGENRQVDLPDPYTRGFHCQADIATYNTV